MALSLQHLCYFQGRFVNRSKARLTQSLVVSAKQQDRKTLLRQTKPRVSSEYESVAGCVSVTETDQ